MARRRTPTRTRRTDTARRILGPVVFAASLTALLAGSPALAQRHLRVNQLGYAPADPKVAFLLAQPAAAGSAVRAVRTSDGAIVWSGTAGPNRGAWGAFAGVHELDFSALRTEGVYQLELTNTGERSPAFAIAARAAGGPRYQPLARSLLEFMRVQRCGDTSPSAHEPCHLFDATAIVGGPDSGLAVPATGGWHDAGDYLKFGTTVAFTTHLLLWADETSPGLAGDTDANGVSDLLDEARIGTDFLLKLRYAPGRFLYQVQDEDDHSGWRAPETDLLEHDRPGFALAGKNHLGRYAAALARAARAFAPHDAAYAAQCLAAAQDAYATAAGAPDLAGGRGGDFYLDAAYHDKLALGAIELWLTTGQAGYLVDARSYADQAGPGWWFSWADVQGLAHALIAPGHPPSLASLLVDLQSFRGQFLSHPWRMAGQETWGTTMVSAGTAIEALLHERLTGDSTYVAMAYAQRDFILGANAWGVCFVGGQGAVSPHDFHHQIAVISLGGALPGSLTEGPAPITAIAEQGITLADPDEYAAFQDPRGTYHDDRGNWVTNEPTITANATALMLLALLQARTPPTAGTPGAVALARDGLTVTPNPLRLAGEIALLLPSPAVGSLELYDVAGHRLQVLARERSLPAGSFRFPLRGETLPPGLYFVRWRSAERPDAVARVTVIR